MGKYVTQNSDNNTARVAKWGVEATFEDSASMLSSVYLTKDEEIYPKEVLNALNDSEDAPVIAPGTTNVDPEANPYSLNADIGYRFSITGTPEVAVKVTVDAGSIVSLDYMNDLPLIFKIYRNDGIVSNPDGRWGNDMWTYGELVTYLNRLSACYPPNTNLSDIYGEYVIAWEWPFSYDSGNGTEYFIDFDINISVEQLP